MRIEKLVVGQLQANCYLVWDEKEEEGIVIDPGDAGDFIIDKIQRFGFKPKMIVATHGHFDHILAATEVKLAFNIPFLIHQADLFLLRRMATSARFFTGVTPDPAPTVDKFLKEGQLIKFGKEKLEVIETPGHSPGGVSFYKKGVLFSGDTLFKMGVGRTDFPYASEEELKKSLKKLFKLSSETVIYPGHGEETTIGEEKEGREITEKFYW